MIYGKIINGVLIEAPQDLIIEENKVIVNFKNNNDLLIEYGYKLVNRNMPEYDTNTQYLVLGSYSETDSTITPNYDILNYIIDSESELEKIKMTAIQMLCKNLSDEDAIEVKMLFPIWLINTMYEVGDRILYNDTLYKVLLKHTSTAEYLPDIAVSLFAKVLNETISGEIPEWQQPGATNCYMKGDKVEFNGKIYESIIDNNSYSPATYPNGWKEINI